jgi:hypothetical protein
VTRTSVLMKERKHWKAAATDQRRVNQRKIYANQQHHEKSIAVFPIFCHKLDLLDRWNIWGDDSPLVGKEGATVIPNCFLDPSGTHELNTQLLFDILSAEETEKTRAW